MQDMSQEYVILCWVHVYHASWFDVNRRMSVSRRLKTIAMCFGQMYVLGDVPINFDHSVELVTCARKIDADFHLMCDLFLCCMYCNR